MLSEVPNGANPPLDISAFLNGSPSSFPPPKKYYTVKDIARIREELETPFDPSVIFYKPQATTKDKSRAIFATYADPRAYTDRLNEVVGIDGWKQEIVHLTYSPAYDKVKRGWGDKPDTSTKECKLSICVRVTIFGIGSHENIQDAEASEDNATTSAYAAAFKRACAEFGLGRYLYDLPKGVWAPYDADKKQFVLGKPDSPKLPDWAIPGKKCGDCTKRIVGQTLTKDGKPTEYTATQIATSTRKTYGIELCTTCAKVRAEAKKASAGKTVGTA